MSGMAWKSLCFFLWGLLEANTTVFSDSVLVLASVGEVGEVEAGHRAGEVGFEALTVSGPGVLGHPGLHIVLTFTSELNNWQISVIVFINYLNYI